MAKLKTRALQIFIGEVVITLITLTGTLAFLQSNFFAILRNVLIANLLFLACYIVWIRLSSNYEKIYKQGLTEE